MFCRNCGNYIQVGTKFCTKCGKAVDHVQQPDRSPQPKKYKVCPRCKITYASYRNHCDRCGSLLTPSAQILQEPMPPVRRR